MSRVLRKPEGEHFLLTQQTWPQCAGPRHVGGGRVAQVAVVRPDDDARARRVVPLQVGHQVLDDLVEVLVPDVPGHLLPAA